MRPYEGSSGQEKICNISSLALYIRDSVATQCRIVIDRHTQKRRGRHTEYNSLHTQALRKTQCESVEAAIRRRWRVFAGGVKRTMCGP